MATFFSAALLIVLGVLYMLIIWDIGCFIVAYRDRYVTFTQAAVNISIMFLFAAFFAYIGLHLI